jgi:hypothetical protein
VLLLLRSENACITYTFNPNTSITTNTLNDCNFNGPYVFTHRPENHRLKSVKDNKRTHRRRKNNGRVNNTTSSS